MNPHFAEDKIIYISSNRSAFAYKYKRLEQNDYYVNLDYRHRQIVNIVDSHEEAVTQFVIFDEGFERLTEVESLVDLVIVEDRFAKYVRVSMCLN